MMDANDILLFHVKAVLLQIDEKEVVIKQYGTLKGIESFEGKSLSDQALQVFRMKESLELHKSLGRTTKAITPHNSYTEIFDYEIDNKEYHMIFFSIEGDRFQLEKVSYEEEEILNVDHRLVFSGCKALVVEDDEINQFVVEDILTRVKVEVDIVNDGCEAIEKVKENSYDIIFMDLEMPKMGGLEATTLIRKTDTETPIVALSGHNNNAIKQEVLDGGMNDFISKPLDPDYTYKIILKWTDKGVFEPIYQTVKEASNEKESKEVKPSLEEDQLDSAKGLAQLDGNGKLYIHILQKYIENYNDVISRFSSLWSEGIKDDATRLIHSMKGVAGNVGAIKVHQIASTLEESASVNDERGIEVQKKELEIANKKLLEEITEFLEQNNVQVAVFNIDNSKSGNDEYLEVFIPVIYELHKNLYLAKPVELDNILKKITPKMLEGRSEVVKLFSLVRRYRYEEAISLLEELIRDAAERNIHYEGVWEDVLEKNREYIF